MALPRVGGLKLDQPVEQRLWVERAEEEGAGGHGEEEQADGNRAHKPDTGGSRVVKGCREL